VNYFFGIKSKLFNTKLTIPKFQNKKKIKEQILIYQALIQENNWKIEKLSGYTEDENFFFLDQKILDNNKIFFITGEKKLDEFNKIGFSELKSFNNYTNTSPSYRSNIQITNNFGGFSSYQSDYPFNMISKKGGILTSPNLLTNKLADKNILLLKNIYKKPSHESFYAYFINHKLKKIIHKEKIYTNQANFIDLPEAFLDNDIYLFTNEYLCIPLYISMKNNQISFEHTHPPHEYILSDDRYIKIMDLKKKFNEIIN
jgi:hypothetical protein